MIGLIDCNNFYASCERVFNPKLEGKPIGILSNNDGCVIARSNELKPLVAMGTPAFKIPSHIRKKITLLSSNYELYGDMSRRVFDTISEEVSELEIYSIDEAFIHLLAYANPVDYCKYLRKIIKRNTGIPVSIGLSSTKTLAKLANHVAKKCPEYEGVCLLNANDALLEDILKKLPVSEVWGVGSRVTTKLSSLGIETAWQLREADLKQIRKHFSVVLERTMLELRGISCIELDDIEIPKKNIMTSRSLSHATNNLYYLSQAIRLHVNRGAEKLRKQCSVAQAVMVFLKTNRFQESHLQYNPSIVIALPFPTDDTSVIANAVKEGLKAIYRKNYLFMKTGVMLLDLIDKDSVQMDLFNAPQSVDQQSRDRLMGTIDKINSKMGRSTIQLGCTKANAVNNIKRDLLSQRYTTRWNELPITKL